MSDLTRPFAVVTLVLRSGHPSSVGGAVEVLAVTRKGRIDDWNLPGGKVDPGETPRDAARRELISSRSSGCCRCQDNARRNVLEP